MMYMGCVYIVRYIFALCALCLSYKEKDLC